jgi:hypothetical protein
MARLIVSSAILQLLIKEGLYTAVVDGGKNLEVFILASFVTPEPEMKGRQLVNLGTVALKGSTVDYDELMSLVRLSKPKALDNEPTPA